MSSLHDAAESLNGLAGRLPYATARGIGEELETVGALAAELIADTRHADLLQSIEDTRCTVVESVTSGLNGVQTALRATAQALRAERQTPEGPSAHTTPRDHGVEMKRTSRPRHQNKDCEPHIRRLENCGYRCEKRPGGHWVLWPPDRHEPMHTFASTPSGKGTARRLARLADRAEKRKDAHDAP